MTRASTGLHKLDAPTPFEVWRIDLAQHLEHVAIASLSEDERARAARFVFTRDRDRYVSAHAALRELLAQRTGRAAGELRFGAGPQGKPYLLGTHNCSFNLSHSQDVALVVIADAGEIGVDVECLRAFPDASELADRNYTAAERAELWARPAHDRDHGFLRCWTRKEACLKAVGSGLSIAPETFETGLAPIARTVDVVGPHGSHRVRVDTFDAGPGIVAALARIDAEDCPVPGPGHHMPHSRL